MPERWVPRAYQKRMVRWLVEHPEAALFCDPGLGKTSCTLTAFEALRKTGAVDQLLVVAPLRVAQHVWTKADGGEISRWADFKHLRVELLHGPKKQEALAREADVYVVNYDGLAWLLAEGRLQALLRRGRTMAAFDELSRLKHTRTQRFKLLKPWLGRFPRRVGLTGSPASNGLLDLFGQVYALDLGRRLGPYVTRYRLEHFDPTGFGGYDWKLKPDAEKRIYGKLKDLALSLRASDHLDLPPLVERDIWVTLPEPAMKIYRDLEDELIARVNGDEVTAANAAVASGKCRQVAGGGVYRDVEATIGEDDVVEARREVLSVHDAKLEALSELLGELQGQPALVYYQFDHERERIQAHFHGDREDLWWPELRGGLTGAQAATVIRAWNAGVSPVLLAHPASVAHGLNLQGSSCAHVVFYSAPWDLEHYQQGVRRVYRQGTEASRVVVHRLLARKTVDEAVVQALVSKGRTQDALLDALKKARWR